MQIVYVLAGWGRQHGMQEGGKGRKGEGRDGERDEKKRLGVWGEGVVRCGEW